MLNQYKNQIETALDAIRPYLEADGGNVKVVELSDDMVLKLELTGTCSSCPMSTMTLKAGVEEAIKKAIPEITKVEAVNVEIA
ncbi:NifU family protein [Negadavirga shengliensis]|jgi:Fe-S cluster biogenesis protein NfuA|uniref:NifU family protein n=1 Tax=Negadavirga shengliensis TaxID=1389218 RepID=A0ABV9T562_9BACT